MRIDSSNYQQNNAILTYFLIFMTVYARSCATFFSSKIKLCVRPSLKQTGLSGFSSFFQWTCHLALTPKRIRLTSNYNRTVMKQDISSWLFRGFFKYKILLLIPNYFTLSFSIVLHDKTVCILVQHLLYLILSKLNARTSCGTVCNRLGIRFWGKSKTK